MGAKFVPGKGIEVDSIDGYLSKLDKDIDWKPVETAMVLTVLKTGKVVFYTKGVVGTTAIGALELAKIFIINDMGGDEDEEEDDDD